MSANDEEAYENALIELFQNVGWQHVYGMEVERGSSSPYICYFNRPAITSIKSRLSSER